MEAFPRFRDDTRAPAQPLPPLSCDCHAHILGDPVRYPYHPSWPFLPPVMPPTDASFPALRAMHRTLGIARGVLVQPGLYGSDHRLLLDTLRDAPGYRGIAHLREPVADRVLRDMHEAGVRGLRFNFWRRMNEAPPADVFRRLVAQIAPLGWHVKIQAVGEDWPALDDLLRGIRIPAVVDHLGNIDAKLGPAQPSFLFIAELLKRENWFISIGNGDRRSALDRGWDDVAPFAHRYLDVAGARAIWASDWPHLGYRKPMPNDAELIDDLLDRFVADPALRRKILVDTPARLYDFHEER